MSGFNKRLSTILCLFCLLFFTQLPIVEGISMKESQLFPPQDHTEGLRLSTFDIDVTPPVGDPLAYDISINTWDLGLRAKGVVLQGAGLPIVLCAVDWLAIGNEGMDDFKRALAAAVGSIPERIAVNAIHQHDAPRFDAGAEQILIEAGLDPAKINPTQFDGTFARDALRRLTIAVKSSLAQTGSAVNKDSHKDVEVYW